MGKLDRLRRHVRVRREEREIQEAAPGWFTGKRTSDSKQDSDL